MEKVVDSRDFVANYELNQYSYSGFWKGREYEHLAEVHLLQRLFSRYLPDSESRRIVDLGGAYGRLLSVYGEAFKEIILADYSTRELLEGKKNIDRSAFAQKVSYMALNAYRLPLRDNTVDALLSVRVMHHLKDLPVFFQELERVLVPGGVAIIEFANKNHLLSLVRRWLKLDFAYAKEPIYRVQHQQQSSQGMKEGQVAIMYNFSPMFVNKTATAVGLTVNGMFGCSFLRIPILKKLFPTSLLLFKEKVLQKFFGKWLITPSVFAVFQKPGKFVQSAETPTQSNQLQCPTCGETLALHDAAYTCPSRHVFVQKNAAIIDLRDPPPESVDF